jgi:hypothetical protein
MNGAMVAALLWGSLAVAGCSTVGVEVEGAFRLSNPGLAVAEFGPAAPVTETRTETVTTETAPAKIVIVGDDGEPINPPADPE